MKTAREILEAVQLALEQGQEPESILAKGSILSEAIRDYCESKNAPSSEREAILAMLRDRLNYLPITASVDT